MWSFLRNARFGTRPTALFSKRSVFATSAASFVAVSTISTSLILNDKSSKSLEGVDVDSSIDPFPVVVSATKNTLIPSDFKLVASGVRSVTFLGFKVYGVGLYVAVKDETKIASTVREYLKKHEGMSVGDLLDDKDISQQIVDDISQEAAYAVKITPVRNTDFGHLRDGLTKSILASPMAKAMRDLVGEGVEQLRQAFLGFRGSVPKNHTLWVVSDTKTVSIGYEGKKMSEMGVISEPSIARVILVLYLSNAKPLSESLRKSFVSYVEGQI